MKKLLAIILSVVLLLSCFSVMGFAKEKTYTYLLLGDSIARGAGVLNPDEACYGKMVANTNGFNYINDAIDGFTSKNLLNLLDEEIIQADVKKADLISISIGGNDFLKANILELFAEAEFSKEYSEYYRIQKDFEENFAAIIKKIKKINPNAVIFMQTIYNMRDDILKGTNQIGTDLLNESYKKYLKNNPKAYILVDVDSVLTGHSEYLAFDTIHPNGDGNIEIAKLVLKAMKKAGYGTKTEPVIKPTPIEQTGFGVEYTFRVILYYLNYWIERI